MTTKTVTSEELWEKADHLQGWVDALRSSEVPDDAVLLRTTAGEFGETLVEIHTMARHFEDW